MLDDFMTWFGDLCTPLKVFLVLGAISVVMSLAMANVSGALGTALWTLLFFFLYRWMCAKGWDTAVWVLVLLPYILMVGLIAVFAASVMAAGGEWADVWAQMKQKWSQWNQPAQ